LTIDGFVKSPSAVLLFIFRRCDVPSGTPHSSRFARLASGTLYLAVLLMTSYENINIAGKTDINRSTIFDFQSSIFNQYDGFENLIQCLN
jgi:hypothetical protein